MAKLKMLASTIYAHKSQRNELLSYLQHKGVLEIKSTLIDNDQLIKSNSDNAAAQFEKLADTIFKALECLNLATEYKPLPFSSFRARPIVTSEQYSEIYKRMPSLLNIAHSLIDMDTQIKACSNEINKQKSNIYALKAWEECDISLDTKGTRFTTLLLGSFSGLCYIENIEKKLHTINSDIYFDIGVIDATKEQTNIYCICLKEQVGAVQSALTQIEFLPLAFKPDVTATQQIALTEQRINGMETAIERLNSLLQKHAEHRNELELLYDYAVSKQNLNEEISKMVETDSTFVIEGYIPQKYSEKIAINISEKFVAVIELQEPETDDKLLPVALENSAFTAPVQSMVEGYSLPAKADIDPTGFTAIFYYIFFGFMFSDAGYGLIMALGAYIAIKKFKPEPRAKNTLMLFVYCGISSIFWGVLFGSYFGDAITMFSTVLGADPIVMPALINPMVSPTTMLLLSLAIGLVHIFVGLGIKFYQLNKSQNIWVAIFDAGFWILFILGLAMLCVTVFSTLPQPLFITAAVLALAGGVGLLLTQGRASKNIFGKALGGAGSIYGVSGYLSDIMSYSRLMALGIATGVIAAVVNQLCSMFTGGVIGIFAFIIIFIFGHALNFGINALGAYVHTLRLQYVEFYSKFYEGGSPLFKPFASKTKYNKIKEE